MYFQLFSALLKGGVIFIIIIFSAGCEQKPGAIKDKNNITGEAISPDSVSIAYREYGAGLPALVFIHGWSCDGSYWNEQVEYFSQQYHVITIDLAGHGESGLNRKAWTMESYGTDVAAVVKKLNIEQMILIGHSMGGDVAVTAAPLLKGRVEGIVWVDTYRQLGSPGTAEQAEEFVKQFRANFEKNTYNFVRENMFLPGSDKDLMEYIANDMASAPPEVAVPSLESSITFGLSITQTLRKIKVPLFAINPNDGTTDITSMKKYGIDVAMIPGTGHFLMMEKPEIFNKLLSGIVNDFVRKDFDEIME